MKTTKIQIRNLFGIKQVSLDGKSIEISGPKGAGKTSVLDSIRLALTNRSERDYVVRQGETEGEIIIETDTGVSIDRKIRTDKADYILVKEGRMTQNRPAEFLNTIFTPLQLNPTEFTQMSRQEKNRTILNLIEFKWDMNWIQEQFGEIPKGVNYDQHILQVLHDIQAEKGVYFTSRQDINREIRNNTAFVEDIAADIPEGYDYQKWDSYDLSAGYRKLESARHTNSQIEKAKAFVDSFDNKMRGIEAERDIEMAALDRTIEEERSQLNSTIERLKAEIRAAQDKLSGLDSKLKDKKDLVNSQFETKKTKLESDVNALSEWVDREPIDVAELSAEVDHAEKMRKHLNEYKRMVGLRNEIDRLSSQASDLTALIEKARDLPGEILKNAKIPIDGLTVKDGVPLINGLPISNLSDGELLELCVDITIQKPGGLQIILIDKAEGLDRNSREKLYQKCKDKGLQLVATRVTDSAELEITEL